MVRSRWGKMGLCLSVLAWAILLSGYGLDTAIAHLGLSLLTLPLAVAFCIVGLCSDACKTWASCGLALDAGFVVLLLLWP